MQTGVKAALEEPVIERIRSAAPIRRRRRAPRFVPLDAAALFARGLAMGMADVVPGVSGGTIALISGIYERFIGALRSLSPAFLVPLLRGRPAVARRHLARIHWGVLIPLGTGIVLAMLSMSRLITGLMDDHPGPTYSLFFGLILASSWIPLARTRSRGRARWLAMGIGAVGAWLLVGLQTGTISVEATRIDPSAPVTIFPAKLRSPDDLRVVELATTTPRLAIYDPNGVGDTLAPSPSIDRIALRDKASLSEFVATHESLLVLEERRAALGVIFLIGTIAISAMILPGVSGSFLLLFLGQYQAVFTTAHRIVGYLASVAGRSLDPLTAVSGRSTLDDVLFLGMFVAGLGVGLMLFSRFVGWLLARAHDPTMALLTGIMLGALRQPGARVWESRPTESSTGFWTVCILVALMGAAIVLGLHVADRSMQSRGVLPPDSPDA